MSKKPDFFIVGAPKSGTTAMDYYLSRHPDIFTARKEMHFFGRDLAFEPNFYRRDEAAYLEEFSGRQNQARAGEASVWYLLSKSAAAEIKAFNPDSRIIIMLRDPVEMLHSLYYSFRWDGNEHLPTFEQALAAEDDRRGGRRITSQTYFIRGLVYHEIVQYTEQVRRYFEVFGRDRVRVILYEDFAKNAAETCRSTLEFLGVDSRPVESDFRPVNPNKFVKSQALRALFCAGPVRSTVLAVRPWLPRAMFNAMQKVDARIRKLNSRTAARPTLLPETRERLKRDFVPEVERLSILLGRDLSYWNNDYGEWRREAPTRKQDSTGGVQPAACASLPADIATCRIGK